MIQTSDGQYAPGQVLGLETRTLHSAACAFFDQRVASIAAAQSLLLNRDTCFASLLVTPDGLDAGVWPVVGHQPVVLPDRFYPFGALLAKKKPGARVYGSGNVTEFLNAFYGFRAWDDWFKPDYLDGLLLSPDKKPKNLILVKSRQ